MISRFCESLQTCKQRFDVENQRLVEIAREDLQLAAEYRAHRILHLGRALMFVSAVVIALHVCQSLLGLGELWPSVCRKLVCVARRPGWRPVCRTCPAPPGSRHARCAAPSTGDSNFDQLLNRVFVELHRLWHRLRLHCLHLDIARLLLVAVALWHPATAPLRGPCKLARFMYDGNMVISRATLNAGMRRRARLGHAARLAVIHLIQVERVHEVHEFPP